MFRWLGQFVVRRRWFVIAGWLAATAAAVAFLPALSTIVSPDQASFLPKGDEAVRADALAREAFPERPKSGALAVFQRADGAPLGTADVQKVDQTVGALAAAKIPGVISIVTNAQALSPNKKIQLAQIALDARVYDERTREAVEQLRALGQELVKGSDLTLGYTGEAAILVDNKAAVTDAGKLVGLATVVLIIGLQLIIFRSPLAALLPIVVVTLVQVIATRLMAGIGSAADLVLSDFTPTLITVVLFGVGTDYILFLLFRYRERLRLGDDSRTAMVEAVTRVGEAVTSAGAVVVVAFAALAFARLGVFSSMGPALALATAVMVASGLTLVPAVVSLLGPRVFWPSKAWRKQPEGRVSGRVAALVSRRPAVVAAGSALVLAALTAGSVGFGLNYNPVDQLPQQTESVRAFHDLRAGFPAGALNPVSVYLRGDDGRALTQADITAVAGALGGVAGVDSVRPPVRNAAGSVVRIDVVLVADPYGGAALDVVSGPLRDAAHAAAPPGTKALVGGQSGVYSGIRDANNRDLVVVFPVAALLIGLILALLLRGLVAPLYLLGTVGLTFGATLGASVLLFQRAQGDAGLQFAIPVVLYVFVAAIGTDYNILTVTRIREELADGREPREAVRLAIARTGPTIAAAGLVLAGSFAALLLAGIGFLTQMGFAVTVGIGVAAFVTSTLLVPSVTTLLGRWAWWPGRVRPHAAAPVSPAPEVSRDAALTG